MDESGHWGCVCMSSDKNDKGKISADILLSSNNGHTHIAAQARALAEDKGKRRGGRENVRHPELHVSRCV